MHALVPSNHYVRRSGQCKLCDRDLAFVLQHARVLYRTGIRFYFLGWHDIPEPLRRNPGIARLQGMTVLLAHDGTLITAYKNPQAIRTIRRKVKHAWRAYPARRPSRVSRPRR